MLEIHELYLSNNSTKTSSPLNIRIRSKRMRKVKTIQMVFTQTDQDITNGKLFRYLMIKSQKDQTKEKEFFKPVVESSAKQPKKGNR